MSRYDDAMVFFYDHASYSYDPLKQTEDEGRMETANRLALAEAFAKEAGLDFTWEPCEPEDGEPRWYCACVQLPGVSLFGIDVNDDTDPDYARVVEAELASELVPWKAVKAFGRSASFQFI
jgi:hypothetical protein